MFSGPWQLSNPLIVPFEYPYVVHLNGCFTYYPEQGTPAAEMTAQVPEETKIHRADTIMLAQQKIAFKKANAKIGTDITLLVDSVNENTAIGRSYAQAPEIDSVCLIENPTALPGQFINAKVTNTKDYDLTTKQTPPLSS
ncbi:MAG TPA: hypothetical protein ENH94_02630 [Phycisphaerales bacterium]|nr:hypothetical protein [Phycisphaerales bacterium]